MHLQTVQADLKSGLWGCECILKSSCYSHKWLIVNNSLIIHTLRSLNIKTAKQRRVAKTAHKRCLNWKEKRRHDSDQKKRHEMKNPSDFYHGTEEDGKSMHMDLERAWTRTGLRVCEWLHDALIILPIDYTSLYTQAASHKSIHYKVMRSACFSCGTPSTQPAAKVSAVSQPQPSLFWSFHTKKPQTIYTCLYAL